MPKISVIIPVYGHAEFVCEALDSVFAQCYSDFEIIVVNDGSPDASESVLRPYVQSGRIRYITQANQGVAAARNRGLTMASGEYVAFLDDDDVWPVEKLAVQIEQIESSHAVMVGGGYAVYNPLGNLNAGFDDYRSKPEEKFQQLKTIDFFSGNPFASPGQVLIRKSALEIVGGYDELVWGVDDLDLWIRLSRIGEIRKYDGIALHYRVHNTNASSNLEKMAVNTELVIRNNLLSVPVEERRAYERVAYRFLFRYSGKKLLWKGAKSIFHCRPREGWAMIKCSFCMFRPHFISHKFLIFCFLIAILKIPLKLNKVR